MTRKIKDGISHTFYYITTGQHTLAGPFETAKETNDWIKRNKNWLTEVWLCKKGYSVYIRLHHEKITKRNIKEITLEDLNKGSKKYEKETTSDKS